MAKITAICNQKGGVGKTLTAVSLGVGLARMGNKVLLVDVDAQGSLTASLGYLHPDQLETTLATLLELLIMDKPVFPGAGIIHHEEGIDLLPANIELWPGGHTGQHHEPGNGTPRISEQRPGSI